MSQVETTARGPIKRAQIEATIIRADGTIVPLGVVSDSKWGKISLRRALAKHRTLRANRTRSTN